MENTVEEKNKQDVMVSNLPLLFSEGKPKCINSMSVEDLQYFIPFLIKCINGSEPSSWAKYAKFKWWPSDVPWSPIFLTKKHQTENWRNKLQRLVKNCYEYNGCTYLLHFSAKLQTLTGGYRFDDNWDGTTSMYDSTSGKLLVTFQNENMNYDKSYRQQSNTNRPMLLPRLSSPTSPSKLGAGTSNLAVQTPSAAKMVEPAVNDIYLCDYCGADFSSLPAIKAHEAKCMAEKALESRSNITLPELEVKDMDQTKFLWYLSLSLLNQKIPPANVTPAKIRPVVKRTCTLSDKRFTTIPFSSNLGQSFFKATILSSAVSENLINRYEKFCSAKPMGRPSSMTGDYTACVNVSISASNRLRPVFFKRKEEWAHTYSFNKADRRERMKTIRIGLNKRARQLLRQCGTAKLVLERLKPEDIELWTRPKPKLTRPLLQPWVQRSISNLPPSCTVSLAPVDTPQSWLRRHHPSSPLLQAARPVMARQSHPTNQPRSEKEHKRSSSSVLPLITNTWSMRTAKPQTVNSQFILPDLIPVLNRHTKTQSTDPVIIQMPSAHSPQTSSLPSGSKPPSRPATMEIVDLCSSDEEADEKKEASSSCKPPNRLVLPPGISITKVKRSDDPSPSFLPEKKPPESNNNKQRSVAEWFRSTVGLPVLRFMGHCSVDVKKEPTSVDPTTSLDSSLPIVTPLKLGKLPPEKREQMKQSLLKIQQKEKKSPSSEKSHLPSLREAHLMSDVLDPELLPPSGSNIQSPSRELSIVLRDHCKELKEQKGLADASNHRVASRKRVTETEFFSCEEDDSLLVGPSKKTPKLDSLSSCFDEFSDSFGTKSYSTVIEVDVGGADSEAQDSSRASSFGSLTPDSKNPRKRNELLNLLKDECKELRRKGLQDLSFEADSSKRVTRCRTKTLPIAVNKR